MEYFLMKGVTKLNDDPHDIIIAKVIAMTILFFATLLLGLLPYKLVKWFNINENNESTRNIINIMMSFAGGVLLCVTFHHLLPEVNLGLKKLQELGLMPMFNFYFPEFLMCMGFFGMFLIEEIVHVYLHKYEKMSDEKSKNNIKDIDVENNKVPNELDVEIQHHHFPLNTSNDSLIVSSLRGLLVVLALSIHELFEGLACGLEKSTAGVWYMFGAISSHKLLLAFFVGAELVITKTKRSLLFTYIFIFAVVSPLGVGSGILLTNNDIVGVSNATAIIAQGLATGTLVYVTFFEVLNKHKFGLTQYAAVLSGFFLMFGVHFLTI